MAQTAWVKATKDLPTKSAKIRALDALGVPRADIARFLDIRYQHVRNVLTQERPTPVLHAAEAAAVYEDEDGKARVQVDGSVRLPAALAAQLGAAPGETLVAVPQDGGLWIATRKVSRALAQATARALIPAGTDWMSDLREDRRRQFEREERLAEPHKG